MLALSDMKSSIDKIGWYRTDLGVRSELELINGLKLAASELGSIVAGRNGNLVERIRPLDREAARPSSLSKRYGLADFPFHNDTAHWSTPCRFVLLACANPGLENIATWFLDTQSVPISAEEGNNLKRGTFFVRTGRKSFYSSIASDHRVFIRFDPGCMEPMDEDAHRAVNVFSAERVMQYSQRVDWSAGTVIAFDNWRVLHRRGSGSKISSDRLLLRCSAA